MANTDKQALITLVDALKHELDAEPATPHIAQAVHQCERLRQAIPQFHAEGLRFAAFTLNRLMHDPGASLHDSTRAAADRLKEALDAAGFTHPH